MRKGGLYLAIGDSTVYGEGITTPGDGQSKYVNQIQQNITNNYGPVKLINKGMPGTTSSDWWNDYGLNKWGMTFTPNLVTIGLGLNDANQGITVSNFENYVETLIDKIRQYNPNVHIILCTANTIGTNSTISGGVDANVAPYRTAMDTVASSRNNSTSRVDVCHFEQAWDVNGAATYTSDGTHPNKSGNERLAQTYLWPIVQQGAWLTSISK